MKKEICEEMKQEIYEEMLFRLLQKNDYEMFKYLINEFPDMSDKLAEKIEDQISDIELPEESAEEKKVQWEKLCARIKEVYGKDAFKK